MLVLTRKPGEEIMIGQDIRVRVLGVSGNRVRLAFEAPSELGIHRAEIHWTDGDGVPSGVPALAVAHG